MLFKDLHLVNLDDFKYGGTNITTFRLVDPNNAMVQDVVKTWMLGEHRFPTRSFDEGANINVRPSPVAVFINPLQQILDNEVMKLIFVIYKIDCYFRQRQLSSMMLSTCLL